MMDTSALQELLDGFATGGPGAAILAAVGVALLLFGWTLYRVALAGAGSAIGGAAGLGLAQLVMSLARPDQPTWVPGLAIAGVVGALAGIAAFRFMHRVAFFFSGAALGGWGYACVFLLLRERGVPEAQSDFLFAFGIPVAAVLAGFLALWLDRWVIAFFSAVAGALLLMQALDWPYSGIPAPFLALIGLVAQGLFSGVFGGGDSDDEDEE